MSFNWELFGTPNYEIVQKFGANASVGTTYEPLCRGGVYRTPQVAGATPLRIKAGGNANDSSGGSGARKVTIQGLNELGEAVTDVIATNGISASAATANSFLRVFRCFVSESGTYANSSSGSHSGDITIENSAGSEDWAVIGFDGFAFSQTEIAAYSIPKGKEAYISNILVSTDSTKTVDLLLFKREDILQTSAPYSAMRMQERINQKQGGVFSISPETPFGPYPEFTDIGFMAKVLSGTASVEASFEIIMRNTNA